MLYIAKFKGCDSFDIIASGECINDVINGVNNSYPKCKIVVLGCDVSDIDSGDYDDVKDGNIIIFHVDSEQNIIDESVSSKGGQMCELADGKYVLIVSYISYLECYDNYGVRYSVSDLNPIDQYGDSVW